PLLLFQQIVEGRLQLWIIELIARFECYRRLHTLARKKNCGHLAEKQFQRKFGHADQCRTVEHCGKSLGKVAVVDYARGSPIHRTIHAVSLKRALEQPRDITYMNPRKPLSSGAQLASGTESKSWKHPPECSTFSA